MLIGVEPSSDFVGIVLGAVAAAATAVGREMVSDWEVGFAGVEVGWSLSGPVALVFCAHWAEVAAGTF
jgi:hypothetical protein